VNLRLFGGAICLFLLVAGGRFPIGSSLITLLYPVMVVMIVGLLMTLDHFDSGSIVTLCLDLSDSESLHVVW
jgi:hypothetical protein